MFAIVAPVAEIAPRGGKFEQIGEPADRDLLQLDGCRPEWPHADVLVDRRRPGLDDRSRGQHATRSHSRVRPRYRLRGHRATSPRAPRGCPRAAARVAAAARRSACAARPERAWRRRRPAVRAPRESGGRSRRRRRRGRQRKRSGRPLRRRREARSWTPIIRRRLRARRRSSRGLQPGGRSRIAHRERGPVTASLCEPEALRVWRRAAAPRVLILTASVGERARPAGADARRAAPRRATRASRSSPRTRCAAIGGIVKVMSADAAAHRLLPLPGRSGTSASGSSPACGSDAARHPGPADAQQRARPAAPDRRASTPTSSSRTYPERHRGARAPAARGTPARSRSCAAITDLAALDYWASPGVDVHLVTHPESIPEVRRIAGAATRDPLRARLHAARSSACRWTPADARRALGLPADGRRSCSSRAAAGASATSRGAVEEALAAASGVDAGRLPLRAQRAAPRAHRSRSFAGEPRVRVEGFTDRMPEWMAAARRARALDLRAHRARGARCAAARPISYGWGRGHIRAQRRAPSAASASPTSSDSRGELRCRARARARSARDGPTRASRTCRPRPRSCSRPRERARAAAAEMPRSGRSPRSASRAPPRLVVARAAAPLVPAHRGAARHPLPPRAAARCRAHLRRRPASAGHARGARGARGAPARRRRSSSSASRSSAGRRSPPRSPRPGTRSACTATATACCCGAASPTLASDLDRAFDVIAAATGPRAGAATGRPTACSRAVRSGSCGGAAGSPLLWSTLGPRLGRTRDARGDRAARDARARRPATSCCCTTPTTTARRTPGAGRSRRCPAIVDGGRGARRAVRPGQPSRRSARRRRRTLVVGRQPSSVPRPLRRDAHAARGRPAGPGTCTIVDVADQLPHDRRRSRARSRSRRRRGCRCGPRQPRPAPRRCRRRDPRRRRTGAPGCRRR